MGLDDFQTDGPRTFKDNSSVSGHNQEAIHVHDTLDLSNVDLPTKIVQHKAEYFTYIPPEEHIEGTVLFTCVECNVVGSSYEAVVKSDYLDYRDEDWASQFKETALNNVPEKPDMRPDTMKEDSDSEDKDISEGLDSFTS